jgi:hypothetical protein
MILCPVCRQNIDLSIFEDHLKHTDDLHSNFEKLVDEQTYIILGQSTHIGNPYIYYNWDYHIQTKYKISQNDINNYKSTIEELKSNNKDLTLNNIINTMITKDIKYHTVKLLPNIIRIVQTMN